MSNQSDYKIIGEMVLWGSKPGELETLLSCKAENILTVMFLAKRDGYTNFRISHFTNEIPNFISAIR
jgi:hypothetical protein